MNEILQNELKPIREKREQLASDIGEIFSMLQSGSLKARETASNTLHDVKSAMGIDYFNSNLLFKK